MKKRIILILGCMLMLLTSGCPNEVNNTNVQNVPGIQQVQPADSRATCRYSNENINSNNLFFTDAYGGYMALNLIASIYTKYDPQNSTSIRLCVDFPNNTMVSAARISGETLQIVIPSTVPHYTERCVTIARPCGHFARYEYRFEFPEEYNISLDDVAIFWFEGEDIQYRINLKETYDDALSDNFAIVERRDYGNKRK